jgi:hypothetical protein
MTPLLCAAGGVSIVAAVLHAALGLGRPFDRKSLAFAIIMVLLALMLYFQRNYYASTTIDGAVLSSRRQMSVINGFIACTLVFIPAYTRVHFPRVVSAVYWAALVGFFVVNLTSAYSLWFAERPELVRSHFRGEPYNTLVGKAMGPVQYAYVMFFSSLLAFGVAAAIKVYRRGERQRGVTLAVALALVLTSTLVDTIRDNVAGSWPYVTEFGLVTWGLIMSVQLAYDYRVQTRALAAAIGRVDAQAERLRRILGALHALEQDMHAPLHTLEHGIAKLAERRSRDGGELTRLQRSVTRLRELSRAMPDLTRR